MRTPRKTLSPERSGRVATAGAGHLIMKSMSHLVRIHGANRAANRGHGFTRHPRNEGMAGPSTIAARRGHSFKTEVTLEATRFAAACARAEGYDSEANRLGGFQTYRGDLNPCRENQRDLHGPNCGLRLAAVKSRRS